jgi:hypothetical protein
LGSVELGAGEPNKPTTDVEYVKKESKIAPINEPPNVRVGFCNCNTTFPYCLLHIAGKIKSIRLPKASYPDSDQMQTWNPLLISVNPRGVLASAQVKLPYGSGPGGGAVCEMRDCEDYIENVHCYWNVYQANHEQDRYNQQHLLQTISEKHTCIKLHNIEANPRTNRRENASKQYTHNNNE